MKMNGLILKYECKITIIFFISQTFCKFAIINYKEDENKARYVQTSRGLFSVYGCYSR